MGKAFSGALTARIDQFNESKPIRVWSLIVTLFGDAVVPRGGELWAGTIAEILAAYGIGEAPVRAATSRLAKDGWLERARDGRRSFYRLSGSGRRDFAAATKRIYFARPGVWHGEWSLALLPDELSLRSAARDHLRAEGFGTLAPNILIAPVPQGASILPAGRDPVEGTLWLEATGDLRDARAIAARAWQLDHIAAAYTAFLADFGPMGAALEAGEAPTGLQALAARLLLIHRFRRIILRDPLLPGSLLAENWPGEPARALCAQIYRALLSPSEDWLDGHGLARAGRLPAADASLQRRFSDL